MSEANAFDFGKFIPGFDFLQKLATSRSGAASAVPGLGSWVAPTVSVDELERRIKELKAVQFWLEQNTTAIKATIQALEVQKMTLATLQGMNLSLAEVTKAFTLHTGEAAAPAPVAEAPAAPAQWPYASVPASAPAEPVAAARQDEPEPGEADAPEPVSGPAPARSASRAKPSRKPAAKAAVAAKPAAGGMADPMAWWGALTQQFQQIASDAMREAARVSPAVASAVTAGKDNQDAPVSVANSASPTSAGAEKSARTTPTAKKGAAKKAAAKPAGRKAVPKKSTAQAAKKAAATKAPPKKPADKPAARSPLAGWPLPPPFKLGR